jgi:hypothetical protein
LLARNGAGPASAATDGEARKIVGTGRRDGRSSSHTSPQTQAIRAEIIGDDTCAAESITARGSAPVLKLCRLLAAADHDPNQPLHAYRGGMLCIIVRTIAEGAALSVDEHNGTRFAKWKPFSRSAVSSRIAPRQRAATPVAGAAQ